MQVTASAEAEALRLLDDIERRYMQGPDGADAFAELRLMGADLERIDRLLWRGSWSDLVAEDCAPVLTAVARALDQARPGAGVQYALLDGNVRAALGEVRRLSAIPTPAHDGGHVPAESEQVREADLQFLDPTDDASELLSRVNAGLRMPQTKSIVRVIERGGGDTARYDALLADGTHIALGTATDVLDPRKQDARITPRTRHEVPYRTPKEWRPIGLAILRVAAADGATGGDAEKEETKEWLASFASNSTSSAELESVDLRNARELYNVLRDGTQIFRGSDRRLYVRVSHFMRHVNQTFGQRTTANDIRVRLGRLDFKRPDTAEGKLSARDGEQTASRRLLMSPIGFEL